MPRGGSLSGDAPTKEAFLHFSMYGERADAGAVVHLHSTHATAVSILRDVDPADVMPALTAYYVMRVGPPAAGALFRAGRPGSGPCGARTGQAATMRCCWPITAPWWRAARLANAQYATEELEETARLFLMLQSHALRTLTPEQVADLRARFNLT